MTQTLNETPTGSRLHIAIFGRRNAGKSSLINALTNQQAAIVSEVAGTTTDPVRKAMEILPIGPVVIIDTAGIDDSGTLGDARVARTLRVLEQTDLALLVLDPTVGADGYEADLATRIKGQGSAADRGGEQDRYPPRRRGAGGVGAGAGHGCRLGQRGHARGHRAAQADDDQERALLHGRSRASSATSSARATQW